MIKILIVDDSHVVLQYLKDIFSEEPDMLVIGTANNGEEALSFVQQCKPDVITMDIEMPKMNGFMATQRIMETNAVPIVIVTGNWNPEDVEKGFKSIECGALAILEKPPGREDPGFEETKQKLVQTVRLMSEVRVVTRRPSKSKPGTIPQCKSSIVEKDTAIKLVAIGVSTGGPPVLQTLLSKIPLDFPVPIVIVQHIATGFLGGLAKWLGSVTSHVIHIPAHGEELVPGHVYLAPDGYHTGVTRDLRVVLSTDPEENSLRPSVSFLFRSVARAFEKHAVGILLTGMGTDGAAELKMIKENGGITFAQDEASSIIHGMPGEAIRLGAAMHILSPEQIAWQLVKEVHKG